MDRRDSLKLLAGLPVALLLPTPAREETAERGFIYHDLVFRQDATAHAELFDGGPEDPGTVYEAFHEAWRIVDGERVERLSQVSSGTKYRILSPDSAESYSFSFHDNEGKGRPTVRLRTI